MSDWRAFCGDLYLRRFDVEPSEGELEALHRPTVMRIRDRLLVVVSVSTGVPRDDAAPMLTTIAEELASRVAPAEPAVMLRVLREEVWRRFEAGHFDRALPDVMAVATDDDGNVRVWRAGPNGIAWVDARGVRLLSEDLRFAALQRLGATLEERWSNDPLLSEVSELTQIEAPHAAAQEFAVEPVADLVADPVADPVANLAANLAADVGDGCLLLLSRGALPFAAPCEFESTSAWWERDAGWRHGLGATIFAIANEGGQRRGDEALAVLEQHISTARRARLDEVDRRLAELHGAARQLIAGSPSEREAVALQLSRQGGEAWNLLATLAQDGSQAPQVRLAAVNVMNAQMPRGLLEPVAIALLHDAEPMLRGHGIIMCARLYLDALEPLIRQSFDDIAKFRTHDVVVSLSNLARAATKVLSTGRPAPDFPNWEAVAVGAPPPQMPERADDDDANIEYLALRQWLLHLAPEEIGLSRPSLDRPVFGILMETGYPQGTHTLACLVDGSVHNHLSNGMLDQRLGRHESVRRVAAAFLARAQIDWDAATRTKRFPRPGVGKVRFYFLGADEIRVYKAVETQMLAGVDPLAELYDAGHAVLSEIHAIELG